MEAPEGHKYCPQCEEIKSHSEFGRNRSQKDGLADYCKPCHNKVMAANRIKKHGSTRNFHLKRRYGITEDDFDRMLLAQGGVCAICLIVPGEHVDHCHASGQVRGILCFNCNNGLGHFRDDVLMLRRAAMYADGVLFVDGNVLGSSPGREEPKAHAPSRSYHLTGRYGLTAADADRMAAEQHGLCALCWTRPPEHVDHDHDTGAVRYALCLPCNSGLGQFRDQAELLDRAADYVLAAKGEIPSLPENQWERELRRVYRTADWELAYSHN